MTSVRSNTILQLISGIFIFLFVYTALSKLLNLKAFVHVLGRSPLLGDISSIVSYIIPFAELGVSLLLLIPSTKKTGMYAACMLMCIFTVYVGYMLIFVPQLPCSCGGVIQQLSWKQHFVLNLILTILAATAAFGDKLFVATDRGNRKPVTE